MCAIFPALPASSPHAGPPGTSGRQGPSHWPGGTSSCADQPADRARWLRPHLWPPAGLPPPLLSAGWGAGRCSDSPASTHRWLFCRPQPRALLCSLDLQLCLVLNPTVTLIQNPGTATLLSHRPSLPGSAWTLCTQPHNLGCLGPSPWRPRELSSSWSQIHRLGLLVLLFLEL